MYRYSIIPPISFCFLLFSFFHFEKILTFSFFPSFLLCSTSLGAEGDNPPVDPPITWVFTGMLLLFLFALFCPLFICSLLNSLSLFYLILFCFVLC